MKNNQKILLALAVGIVVAMGFSLIQRNDTTDKVKTSEQNLNLKTYVNEEDGYEITVPTEVTTGIKSENSVLGTVQNPISGTYIGHVVFVELNTPQLKTLGRAYMKKYEDAANSTPDYTGPYISCEEINILRDSSIIKCIGEGGPALYGYIKGVKTDIFIDTYSQGWNIKRVDFVSFKSDEDLINSLKTFKFQSER